MSASPLLFRDVEVRGQGICDVRVVGGRVREVGTDVAARGESIIHGHGGVLLPGLADHHLHLAAMSAAETSVDLTGTRPGDLHGLLGGAQPGADGWIRAIGYDDVTHGDLDRHRLDTLRSGPPLRVQHRSGALWVLNSEALARIGAGDSGHPGIERDATGTPTGRLWRSDDWLTSALGPPEPPSLRRLGEQLASFGLTHLTDASPHRPPAQLAASAVRRGELPQRVMLMAPDLDLDPHPRLSLGPVKIVASDHDLPDLDELVGRIDAARRAGRNVAVHCVTRVSVALTLAALDIAGCREGDRIEHCAVADAALVEEIAARGLRVVTQPTLVSRRGDDYLDRADPRDRCDLWPFASLLRAGVRAVASSDAPYGDPDPWTGMNAAVERLTASGRVVGQDERVRPHCVLDGLLAPLEDPGGPPRRVSVGQPADLVLLGVPLGPALERPDRGNVRMTLIGGEPVFGAGQVT